MKLNLFQRAQSLLMIVLLISCGEKKATENTDTSASTVNIADDWKLGIAFWTFHTFSLPEAIEKIDSAGIHIVEAPTFFKSGAALKDSLIGDLSPAGIEQVKVLLNNHNIQIESMYIGGDKTVESWVKQFDKAKELGAKFVTAEPPIVLWDEIDSLAGIYGMKVAIHEHWKGVSPYWHPDSVLAAIKDHPNFGACADLGHWPKSGVDPLEGVKRLEGHIIALHLKDIAEFNNPKIQDVPVGTGVVDFPAVFAELKRQNFKGPIYIERDAEDKPSNLPSVMQTIKYYNEQVSKLQ
jgi:sugar phosphate isomerase/epimerase